MTMNDPAEATNENGFFAKLFDFSFEEFITLSIIKIIYILLLVLSGLGALAMFLGLASQGGVGVVFGLVVAPILFLVYVILTRVWLEFLIVVFRIERNSAEIARNTRT